MFKFPDLLPEIQDVELCRREALVDNVLFWALLDHLDECMTSEQLDHVARRVVDGYRSGKLSPGQYKALYEKGRKKREQINGSPPQAA